MFVQDDLAFRLGTIFRLWIIFNFIGNHECCDLIFVLSVQVVLVLNIIKKRESDENQTDKAMKATINVQARKNRQKHNLTEKSDPQTAETTAHVCM